MFLEIIRRFKPGRESPARKSPKSLHCVFVVGCQRSGTTLVGQILGAHPHAVLIDEDHGVYELMDAVLNDTDNQKRALQKCLVQSRKMYAQKRRISSDGFLDPSVTHLIFKVPNTTYDFDRLRKLHSDRMHVVFPVRDVRDVVCSMQRLTHIPMVENQIKLIACHPQLAARFSDELARLNDQNTPDHVCRAIIWRIKTGLLTEFLGPPLDALTIRYDDLVLNREYWIRRLLDHVKLDGNADAAYHHEDVLRGFGPGLTRRTREIDATSIGQWQEQLSEDEHDEIWNEASGLMSHFGYERRSPTEKRPAVGIPSEVLSCPVIATGRGGSGTRLLSVALQEHGLFLGNQFNKRSEDSIEWTDLVYELSIRKLMGTLPSRGQLPHELTRQAEQILGKGQWQQQDWGWKLPETMLILPEVADALPNSRIIHLVRHPLDVCLRRTHVTSRMDNAVGEATLLAAYQWLNWDRSPHDDADHVRNAASWAFQVDQAIRTGRSLGSERYLEVKYEDLCARPQVVSDELAGFLNRPTVSTNIDQIVDHERRRQWTNNDERVQDVWSVCEKTAALLGYQFPS